MIKLHPRQSTRAEAKISFQGYFPAARWIWLRRSDLIARAVAHEITSRTDAWITGKTGNSVPEYSTVSISETISDIDASNQQWNAHFNRNNIADAAYGTKRSVLFPKMRSARSRLSCKWNAAPDQVQEE